MTKKYKLLFFGTPEIAVPLLQKLAQNSRFEIVGVGVSPDKKVGRKQILTSSPVKLAAESLGLPIFEIKHKSDLAELGKKVSFDRAIVIAFGIIFPREVVQSKKFLNVHFSLLPKWRGASPVQSAILAGEKISGITIQEMAESLDSGAILWQEKISIGGQKTSEVFSRFAEHTAGVLPQALSDVLEKKIVPVAQKEADATFCKKIQKSDGEVFPGRETASQIFRKFCAFDLWPGTFLSTEKGKMKLTAISLAPCKNAHRIPCANNTEIFIERAQIPGKKEMSITEILRGNPNLFSRKK